METYVRLEGVNLNNFIEDVHDLSTIRGGSFLLLDAVEKVRRKFDLEAITTGASSGLFRSTATTTAADLRNEIERFLNADPELKHGTFVVDACATDQGFLHAREALAAMNRWRQFQQPTVAVPSRPPKPVNIECQFDHCRPAVDVVHKGKDRHDVSASVKARRDYGRRQKRDFYKRELSALLPDEATASLIASMEGLDFASDLEEITDDETRGSLDGKMAIVYFDGNGFGTIQKNCTTADEQADFDRTLKRHRRTALRALLQDVVDHPDGWMTGDRIRLETLLWGGDELTWVVPAWKAWDVMRLFYETSATWTFHGQPLTHAGGIVFCHRKAPIHRMTHLAKDLAECCKEVIRARKSKDHAHATDDRFAYQVLESFDHIGPELNAFRDTRVPSGRNRQELIVAANGMDSVRDAFEVVRKHFPRSKLHEIVLALRDKGEAEALITDTVKDLDDEATAALATLRSFFTPSDANSPTAWFHVAELWDYAV